MKKETFEYKLKIEAPPYAPETMEETLGVSPESCNPDFGRDVFARETLWRLFQDAMSHCLSLRCSSTISKELSKQLKKRADFYGQLYEKIESPTK